jgi:hypothetical protein
VLDFLGWPVFLAAYRRRPLPLLATRRVRYDTIVVFGVEWFAVEESGAEDIIQQTPQRVTHSPPLS